MAMQSLLISYIIVWRKLNQHPFQAEIYQLFAEGEVNIGDNRDEDEDNRDEVEVFIIITETKSRFLYTVVI